jgi:hypothetical protein
VPESARFGSTVRRVTSAAFTLSASPLREFATLLCSTVVLVGWCSGCDLGGSSSRGGPAHDGPHPRVIARVATPPAPGPAPYDRVLVAKYGPASARKVFVLIPGIGASGYLRLVARELADRVPGMQVWTVDRRERGLEDTHVFARTLAGRATPQRMFDYYLGWMSNGRLRPHFRPRSGRASSFVRGWGLTVLMNDLHRVVQLARRGGRTVILGGHSLGAGATSAYATWDFGGRPGYRGLAGIVLIDGGLLGTFSDLRLDTVRRLLRRLRSGSPFFDLLHHGFPWLAGVISETGAVLAKLDPNGPSLLQQSPLLPRAFKPSVPVTNRAFFGYAFDHKTSPKAFAPIQVHSGRLAPTDAPRGWTDTGISPIGRLEQLLGEEPNGVDWYLPIRLQIDIGGASRLTRNPVTKLLRLRTYHLAGVDVPLYAFQSSLTHGRVLRAARAFIRSSKVPWSVLVDRSGTTSHLDPLSASPSRNDFLKTVLPFLRRVH